MSESVAKEAGPPPTDHPEVTEEKAPGDAAATTAPGNVEPEKKKREYKEFEGEKQETTREYCLGFFGLRYADSKRLLSRTCVQFISW
jgi:hypothetical protein